MGFRRRLRTILRSLLARRGYMKVRADERIVSERILYDWQREPPHRGPIYKPGALPDGAEGYLRPDHPRLEELTARYAAFDPQVTTPRVWREGHVRREDLLYFRGDNAYVWQLRGTNMNPTAYALTSLYLQSIDKLRLFEKLDEDELFGIFTFRIGDRLVSRDLLDSISEIDFLERHLSLSTRENFTILDIGAGYGRLAHRMAIAVPAVRYLCTDAIPVSTFISEYYLRLRGVEYRATVVALDELDAALSSTPVDLAVNIHSFPECPMEAIEWWIALLARHGVRFLMLVPNLRSGELVTAEEDFTPVLERHGYRLFVREPKYLEPMVQQYGINPGYHYLFELR